VQRSIDKPFDSNDTNVSGTLNMLKASIDNKVRRFIFASSSSVYGDSEVLPKKEDMNTNPRSIYAVSKLASEYYTRLFYNIYGLETISLRYFNVFGRRQNPDSIYSAVIPVFLKNLKSGKPLTIFGDGNQSRDFTYIDNVIDANLKACLASSESSGEVFNIAAGGRDYLIDIYHELNKVLNKDIEPIFGPNRPGDIKHSNADITKAKNMLNYNPKHNFKKGLNMTIEWYKDNLS